MDSPSEQQNVTAKVYLNIRENLIASNFLPGQKINISKICQDLNVGQGAVREALSRMMAEGFVEAEPNRGFVASEISLEGLKSLTEARLKLDEICIREAIELGGIDWEADVLAASHRAARRRAEAHKSEHAMKEFLQAHAQFHTTFVSAVDNPWLKWIRSLLYAHTERYQLLCIPSVDSKPDLYTPGSPFLDAVLARDADKAVEAMRKIYIEGTASIMDQFADAPPAEKASAKAEAVQRP